MVKKMSKATKKQQLFREQAWQFSKSAYMRLIPQAVASEVTDILSEHTRWLLSNPNGTVGQLRKRLEKAAEQCQRIADKRNDPHILDYKRIPEPLASELSQWDNEDEECTFSSRMGNLEDYLMALEQIEEIYGGDFVIADFLPKEWRAACRAAA